jgi:hypothetical protein
MTIEKQYVNLDAIEELRKSSKKKKENHYLVTDISKTNGTAN